METYEKRAMNEKLKELREMSAYWLADSDLADCMSPDSKESPGALLLASVRDSVCDLIEDNFTEHATIEDFDRFEDEVFEIADQAPSIYTHQKWQEFVDLGAHQEDVEELGGGEGDMDKLGSIALFIIAERLTRNLVEKVKEAVENADEPDDAEG